MQRFTTDPPQCSPKTINGVKFTPREIDVIACLLSGRGAKTVAQFLAIDEKTVETHKYNVMRKLECNSKEGIIDFVEKSKQIFALKQHYLNLLNQSIFEKYLQKILHLVGKKEFLCTLVYEQENRESFLLDQLEKHLKLVGVKVHVQTRKPHQFLSHFLPQINLEINFLIYLAPKSFIKQLEAPGSQARLDIADLFQKNSQGTRKIIFLSQNEEDFLEVPQEISEQAYVEMRGDANYYLRVFKVLQFLFSNTNFETIIAEFNQHCETIGDSFGQSSSQSLSQMNDKATEKSSLTTIALKSKHYLLIGGVVVYASIIGVFIPKFNPKFNENKADYPSVQHNQGVKIIRSDLPIPGDHILLKRPKLLTQIKESLKGEKGIQTIALAGIGGSGKTTLARQYAKQQDLPLVWEVNADTKETLFLSFKSLAYALCKTEEEIKILKSFEEIKNSQERDEKLLMFVKEKLRNQAGWLLLFDNVEKFTNINQFFPHDSTTWGKGKIIITTQNSNIQKNEHVNKTIFIECLTHQEKYELFTKIINSSGQKPSIFIQQQQEDFLQHLPPFPLDISIAARYLKDENISYKKYLTYMYEGNKEFQTIQENILDEGGTYTKTRYSIINLSLKRFLKIRNDFMGLLFLISLLDSQNIPKDLLYSYKNDLVVDNFIYYLKKYSLITHESFSHNSSAFSLHRSTQKIILNYLIKVLNLKDDHSLIQSISQNVENYMAKAIEKEDTSKMKMIIPHGKIFLSHSHILPDATRDSLKGELTFMEFYLNCSQEALQSLERIIENFNKSHYLNASKVVRILFLLGYSYRDLGNYQKAKEFFEESLHVSRKYLSQNPTKIAKILTHLGSVYRYCGNLEKAKNVLEESLVIYKRYSNSNFVDFSWSLRYLGDIYKDLGDYTKAKDLFEQSLIICEKHLPEDHIGWDLTYLGIAHKELGNYIKAKNFLEQRLVSSKRHFLDDHMEVGLSLITLGIIHGDLGDYEKSKELLEKGIAICKKHVLDTNLEVAAASLNLGKTYMGLKDYVKAKILFDESLKVYKNHLPENHFKIARIILYLGNVYNKIGDYKKAKELLTHSLIIFEKHYGKNHIETARVLRSLGEVYFSEGDLKTTESLTNKALDIFQKNKHSEGYTCLENLAELHLRKFLQAKNENNEAFSKKFKHQTMIFLKKALPIVEENFPKDCPHLTRIQFKLRNMHEIK